MQAPPAVRPRRLTMTLRFLPPAVLATVCFGAVPAVRDSLRFSALAGCYDVPNDLLGQKWTYRYPGEDDKITNPTFHQKAYVCVHVFDQSRPVLLVSREDGDWCFLCGDVHPDSADHYRVVGRGHVVYRDFSLSSILDLLPNEEAERVAIGEPWIRTVLKPQ